MNFDEVQFISLLLFPVPLVPDARNRHQGQRHGASVFFQLYTLSSSLYTFGPRGVNFYLREQVRVRHHSFAGGRPVCPVPVAGLAPRRLPSTSLTVLCLSSHSGCFTHVVKCTHLSFCGFYTLAKRPATPPCSRGTCQVLQH